VVDGLQQVPLVPPLTGTPLFSHKEPASHCDAAVQPAPTGRLQTPTVPTVMMHEPLQHSAPVRHRAPSPLQQMETPLTAVPHWRAPLLSAQQTEAPSSHECAACWQTLAEAGTQTALRHTNGLMTLGQQSLSWSQRAASGRQHRPFAQVRPPQQLALLVQVVLEQAGGAGGNGRRSPAATRKATTAPEERSMSSRALVRLSSLS